jgi:hypothetical protein
LKAVSEVALATTSHNFKESSLAKTLLLCYEVGFSCPICIAGKGDVLFPFAGKGGVEKDRTELACGEPRGTILYIIAEVWLAYVKQVVADWVIDKSTNQVIRG